MSESAKLKFSVKNDPPPLEAEVEMPDGSRHLLQLAMILMEVSANPGAINPLTKEPLFEIKATIALQSKKV